MIFLLIRLYYANNYYLWLCCWRMKKSKSNVILPAILDASGFAALRESLAEIQTNTRALSLDASKVERVSTPCVQLLASCLRGGATITCPSLVLSTAWEDLGLNAQFPLTANPE